MVIQGFLALDEETAHQIQKSRKVEPNMFGHSNTYVPLKPSKEKAAEAMLRSSRCPPRVVKEKIHLYLLTFTFADEQILQAFKDFRLTNECQTYRFHGELELGVVSFEWGEFALDPIGEAGWVEMNLNGNYQQSASVNCAGCNSSEETTWVSNHKNVTKNYCTSCWVTFLETRFKPAV